MILESIWYILFYSLWTFTNLNIHKSLNHNPQAESAKAKDSEFIPKRLIKSNIKRYSYICVGISFLVKRFNSIMENHVKL